MTTELIIFWRQLATMLKSGITLTDGFSMLLSIEKNPRLKKLIQALKTAIETGNTLAHACQQQPRHIDYLTCHLIHIAEQTGMLDKMLLRIADTHEKNMRLKNKFKQALIYPTMIVVTASIVTLTMLMFVIPRFAELFANVGAPLPTLTLVIIRIAHGLHQHSWVLLCQPLTGAIVYYSYKKSPNLKHAVDKIILDLPLIGAGTQKTTFARFARTLASIIAAGMPITDGLKMLGNISNNLIIRHAIQKLRQEIICGKRIYQAMQNTKAFPALLIQMVRVGEEAGAMEQMLDKTAEFYEAELDYWVNGFSHILEPLIIIVLGVLIGGLVIAMYLPIFKLGTVI